MPETLSDEILEKLHAPPKPDIPVITVDALTEADAFLFGKVLYIFGNILWAIVCVCVGVGVRSYKMHARALFTCIVGQAELDQAILTCTE